MRKTRKLLIILPVIAAAAVLMTALARQTDTVATAKAEKRNITDSILVLGTVTPYGKTDIVNPAALRIEKLCVSTGDRAAKGDILYVLSGADGGTTDVAAPADGDILGIYAYEGMPAAAGAVIMTMGDTKRPFVAAMLTGNEAYRAKEGMRVSIKADGASERYTGHISKAAPCFLFNRETGLYEREFIIEPDGNTEGLIAGAAAECEIITGETDEAVTVPVTAIAYDGSAYVYVESEGRAERRNVRLLLDDGRYAAVEGIADGEYVVRDIRTFSEKQ